MSEVRDKILASYANNHAQIKAKLELVDKKWPQEVEHGFDIKYNVRQIIEMDEKLVTFNGLLDDLFPDKFLTKAKYTVFAPTNGAFSKLDRKVLNKLVQNESQIKRVLQTHIIKGLVLDVDQLEELTEDDQIATVASDAGVGYNITFDKEGNDLYVTRDNATASAKIIDTLRCS